MSGSVTIYRLQPVFHIPEKMDLPEVMYSVKNPVACVTQRGELRGGEGEVSAALLDKEPLPEIASLESRWETVFKELSQVKILLTGVKKTIADLCETSGCKILHDETKKKLKVLQGIVINADPANPPYFLLLVKHLCKTYFPIAVMAHVHSSLSSLPSDLSCFSESLPQNKNTLLINLIWKKGSRDIELILNPVNQIPIRGEVNLLRFFAQSGLDFLCYPSADICETLQTDFILDLCHRLLHIKTAKEKSSILKNLNAKLGRSSYFGGNNINIRDVAVWSVLKQINVNPSQDLSQNMGKWFERVNNF